MFFRVIETRGKFASNEKLRGDTSTKCECFHAIPSFSQTSTSVNFYLTIRQQGRVVYELIVNEGAARVEYLFRDNEAELSNCFSIHSYPKYKL